MGDYALLGTLISPVHRARLLREALEAAFVDDAAATVGVEDEHLLGLFGGTLMDEWVAAAATDKQALVIAGIARVATRIHRTLQTCERWSRHLARRAIILPIYDRDIGARLVQAGQLYSEVAGAACPPFAQPLPADFTDAMTWLDGPRDGSERAVIFCTPPDVAAQGEFREVCVLRPGALTRAARLRHLQLRASRRADG